MKQLILLSLATLSMASCSHEPLEDSKKYDPTILQESHVITYDAGKDVTSVESMVKTGANENYSTGELNGGKYVMLTLPASLMINNEPMKLDSERFVGNAYIWTKPGFVKDLEISYINQKEENYKYIANVNPIDIKDDFLEIYKNSDSYYFKWVGEPIGANEVVSLYIELKETDDKGKSKTVNKRLDADSDGDNKVNISKSDLDKLLDDDRIEMYAERRKHVKSSSSSNPSIVIYKYISAKRYLKTKQNLLDMIISL